MRPSRPLPIPLVLALLLPSVAGAQVTEPPAVPVELVQALLPGFAPGEVSPPEILVGRLPDPVRAVITLPPAARVIGSAVFPRSSRTVIAVPVPADAVIGDLRAQLERSGWRRFPIPQRGGFESSPAVEATPFCRDDGTSLMLLLGRAAGAEQYLNVYHQADPQYSVCAERVRGRGVFEQSPIPPLLPPAGAEVRGSGSGSGGDRADAHAELRTDLPPEALIRHYGAQLREHGWRPLAQTAVAEVAVQTWEVRDDGGDLWRGALVVTAPEPRTRQATLQVHRVAPQP